MNISKKDGSSNAYFLRHTSSILEKASIQRLEPNFSFQQRKSSNRVGRLVNTVNTSAINQILDDDGQRFENRVVGRVVTNAVRSRSMVNTVNTPNNNILDYDEQGFSGRKERNTKHG